MNLFLDYQKKFLKLLNHLKKKKKILLPKNIHILSVELPPKNLKADISSNMAMLIAKINNQTPMEIAEILKLNFIKNFKEFDNIEIAKPGFLNFKFKVDFWEKYLIKIVKLNNNYGSNIAAKKNFNVEFVSANPTGPLHVGHCRGAIIGDAISNLLRFNGHNVTKEYYVNDYGKQIEIFVNSVYFRILEITEKKKFPDDINLYPGEYIKDIAEKIIKTKKIKNFKNLKKIYNQLLAESLKLSMALIKNNLSILGIKHDNFIYESNLIKNKTVEKTIKKLQKAKYVYKGRLKEPKGETATDWRERDQILFSSTSFGDDTDRALQKIDKSWTYFASDIAYHSDKIKRKFDVLINILGSDHTGYIKRINAAVMALSKNKVKFVCKVSQLVKLLKKGQPIKMSKRKGDYITVDDLIREVGRDSVRFMMLNRNSDVVLDFDFEKVTEKSKDNPVFYVQYAYARINSIFRILKLNIEDKIDLKKEKFFFNDYEIEMLKKISEWPKCVESSTAKLEPNRIPTYLYELVTLFHSYWNLGKENKELRFISANKSVSNYRILLLKALSIVIKNGMKILGVTTPKSM